MDHDRFASFSDSPMSPSRDCFSVIPDDLAELPTVPKAIYVGTGGDIALRSIDGVADVTFRNLPSGFILDVRVSHLRATGTTASNIVGLA